MALTSPMEEKLKPTRSCNESGSLSIAPDLRMPRGVAPETASVALSLIHIFPLRDVLLHFGYMHPMLSDRGKNVFGYLGLSALCVYEELNDDKRLLPDGATLLDLSLIHI